MKSSFPDILESIVTIPIIQRDYAQGRTDVHATRVRKDFLDALFLVLRKRIEDPFAVQNLELDFVYGIATGSRDILKFYPIDGQQRLTTLWLFWWYVSVRERVIGMDFLFNFRYETRHSTTVFCEKLLAFGPNFQYPSIEEEIRNQSWYFNSWDFDPSIRAMLVMLNEIELRYTMLDSVEVWPLLNHVDSPFYFYKLDMTKVGLPDDLYIKMNSRGKPLTEFEYFKANFSKAISNERLRIRFQLSIDQEWSDAIWKVIFSQHVERKNVDLANLADNAFMRLINFLTDVIAAKQVPFEHIHELNVSTLDIYRYDHNLISLFEILDRIVVLQKTDPQFWDRHFYLKKESISPEKTRFFFQHGQVNLLEKCLLSYDRESTSFSYPEQVMLYACLVHLLNNSKDFLNRSRVVRNLAANSSNELRAESIGQSFSEVEAYVCHGNLQQLVHFKSEQISEEKEKQRVTEQWPYMGDVIRKLEDSDLMRGTISIFDLDEHLPGRANVFLETFDEDVVVSDFKSRANLLLLFGDYSQDDSYWTNLLAASKTIWRKFFTTPAYNKEQLFSKTKPVVMACLDFIKNRPALSIEKIIVDRVSEMENLPKDWSYYFLKYPRFREGVNKGYYYWDEIDRYPR